MSPEPYVPRSQSSWSMSRPHSSRSSSRPRHARSRGSSRCMSSSSVTKVRARKRRASAMRLEGWRTNLAAPLSNARRIVSIAPSNTEILHALGLGRRIVGVDSWSDYPPRVLRLPRLGSDLRVDVARVAELQPDLVVASLHVPGMQDNLPAFDAAGVAYLALGGLGLDGVWQDMRVIGTYLGRPER